MSGLMELVVCCTVVCSFSELFTVFTHHISLSLFVHVLYVCVCVCVPHMCERCEEVLCECII